METIPSLSVNQVNSLNSLNLDIGIKDKSIFSKIFEYKYFIILIILLIISIYLYYYKIKPKYFSKDNIDIPNQSNKKKSLLKDFIVADINGKVIKITGEQVGEISIPNNNNSNKNKKPQTIIQEESSDENINTKQHDLTNSEIKEITDKLKN